MQIWNGSDQYCGRYRADTVLSTDRWTDGRTDGRMTWNQYTPFQLRWSGGYKKLALKKCHDSEPLSHYCDVTWALWHLKAMKTQLFLNKTVWLVGSGTKGQQCRKLFYVLMSSCGLLTTDVTPSTGLIRSGLIAHTNITWYWHRADSRLAPSQWETLLQSNAVSHWLGTKT